MSFAAHNRGRQRLGKPGNGQFGPLLGRGIFRNSALIGAYTRSWLK